MKRAFIVSFIIIFVLSLWILNSGSNQPNSLKQSLLHNGIERDYLLYVPEGLPENAPLVVVAHGYTSSAEIIMAYSGMNKIADEEKFLVVYPQGTTDLRGNNFFNVGYSFHASSKVDDLDFIKTLVTNLIEEYNINSDHVFATGMSNGGDLSYFLACYASDIFTAVAPIAGTMMQTTIENCSPNKPMPIFEIHGDADDVTLFDGDMADKDGWGPYPDNQTIIDFWVKQNNLELYDAYKFSDINPNDDSSITFHKYWSDMSGNEVWFYVIENGGHDWPLLKSPFTFWKSPLGWWYFSSSNMDIDTSAEIWNFFKKYSD